MVSARGFGGGGVAGWTGLSDGDAAGNGPAGAPCAEALETISKSVTAAHRTSFSRSEKYLEGDGSFGRILTLKYPLVARKCAFHASLSRDDSFQRTPEFQNLG